MFDQTEYRVELPENMTAGTRVIQVHADDVDTGMGGRIRYTQILGYLNTSLNLDASSGIITVSTNNHGFDREKMPEYHLYVEARDDDGIGNRAEVSDLALYLRNYRKLIFLSKVVRWTRLLDYLTNIYSHNPYRYRSSSN
jgi:hypothetical protein